MLDGRWRRPDVRVTPQPETLADNVESLLFFVFGLVGVYLAWWL